MICVRSHPCPQCGGTGTVLDSGALGKKLRALREISGVTVQGLARRMGLHKSYVSYLEAGKRNWTREMADAYLQCLGIGAGLAFGDRPAPGTAQPGARRRLKAVLAGNGRGANHAKKGTKCDC